MTALVWAGRSRPKLAHAASKVRSGQASRLATHTPRNMPTTAQAIEQDNADLAGIVVIVVEPLGRRLRRVECGKHDEDQPDACHHHDDAVHADRVGAPGGGHGQPCQRDKRENDDCELAFAPGELCDHIIRSDLG